MNRRWTRTSVSITAILVAACGSGAGAASPTKPDVAATTPLASPGVTEPGCVVGVAWAGRTGRWEQWDEPAIRQAVASAGAGYLSNDAGSSAAAQASNVDDLISRGATVIIVVAQDGTAIEPVVAAAIGRGVPVIAYDRLIDNPAALYVTFDNVEVGRMQARALLQVAPRGDYLFIKGDKADANSDLLRSGQEEVLRAAIAAGDIVNAGETYTPDWDPQLAQAETTAFLAANDNRAAAVLAENDGMAGGVIAALDAVGLAGKTAVSGEDGDVEGLRAVALGTQTVDVWKDARALGTAAGEAAVKLCAGATVETLTGTAAFTTPSGKTLRSIVLEPVPITRDNLDLVLAADWVTPAELCGGVAPGVVAACG